MPPCHRHSRRAICHAFHFKDVLHHWKFPPLTQTWMEYNWNLVRNKNLYLCGHIITLSENHSRYEQGQYLDVATRIKHLKPMWISPCKDTWEITLRPGLRTVVNQQGKVNTRCWTINEITTRRLVCCNLQPDKSESALMWAPILQPPMQMCKILYHSILASIKVCDLQPLNSLPQH